MPLIQFSMNCRPEARPPTSEVDSLLGEATRSAASALGKPEGVLMVRVSFDSGYFDGSSDPSCCVHVQQIGAFEDEARSELSRVLTWLAGERLGVAEERVFVLFQAIEGTHWSKGGRLLRSPAK